MTAEGIAGSGSAALAVPASASIGKIVSNIFIRFTVATDSPCGTVKVHPAASRTRSDQARVETRAFTGPGTLSSNDRASRSDADRRCGSASAST